MQKKLEYPPGVDSFAISLLNANFPMSEIMSGIMDNVEVTIPTCKTYAHLLSY